MTLSACDVMPLESAVKFKVGFGIALFLITNIDFEMIYTSPEIIYNLLQRVKHKYSEKAAVWIAKTLA